VIYNYDESKDDENLDKIKVKTIMRHYIRINKQIILPLSLEAEAYLEEYGLRDEVIHWRDTYCVFNE
jgi:hypothetical protein